MSLTRSSTENMKSIDKTTGSIFQEQKVNTDIEIAQTFGILTFDRLCSVDMTNKRLGQMGKI